jgi:hypothetical protein
MENYSDILNHHVRSYFLQQGKSITLLYNILDSNIFIHHVKKWLSLIIEAITYLFVIGAIAIVAFVPDFFHDEDENLMIILKSAIIGLMLPTLAFARLLASSRKKNELVREAYMETVKMKEEFERAKEELDL